MIEVFRDDAIPSRPFKQIGILKDDGTAEEQEKVEAKMITKAKKMGGSAIVFDRPKQSGMEASYFSFPGAIKYTYLYRSVVVVYE